VIFSFSKTCCGYPSPERLIHYNFFFFFLSKNSDHAPPLKLRFGTWRFSLWDAHVLRRVPPPLYPFFFFFFTLLGVHAHCVSSLPRLKERFPQRIGSKGLPPFCSSVFEEKKATLIVCCPSFFLRLSFIPRRLSLSQTGLFWFPLFFLSPFLRSRPAFSGTRVGFFPYLPMVFVDFWTCNFLFWLPRWKERPFSSSLPDFDFSFFIMDSPFSQFVVIRLGTGPTFPSESVRQFFRLCFLFPPFKRSTIKIVDPFVLPLLP